MVNTLYTLGYARWSLDQVEAVATMRDALLVDVRLKPFSRKPGFAKAALARRLGARYQHVEALGNVNYQGGPIQLRDPDLGLFTLEQHIERQPVILLCGCANVETCHRKTIADLAAERFGLEVIHLDPDQAR